jgi:hypothetical protein
MKIMSRLRDGIGVASKKEDESRVAKDAERSYQSGYPEIQSCRVPAHVHWAAFNLLLRSFHFAAPLIQR